MPGQLSAATQEWLISPVSKPSGFYIENVFSTVELDGPGRALGSKIRCRVGE
jgi:hypothetical protein